MRSFTVQDGAESKEKRGETGVSMCTLALGTTNVRGGAALRVVVLTH